MFIARLKDRKDKQTFEAANRIEKTISEQGFEVQRMKKADIKRFLALYFEASMNGEQMPDIDGEHSMRWTMKLRKISLAVLSVLLSAVAALSGFMVYTQLSDRQKEKEEFDTLAEMVEVNAGKTQR